MRLPQIAKDADDSRPVWERAKTRRRGPGLGGLIGFLLSLFAIATLALAGLEGSFERGGACMDAYLSKIARLAHR